MFLWDQDGKCRETRRKVFQLSKHDLDAVRCAPWVGRSLHAIQHPVEHFRYNRRRTFSDGASRTQQCDHRTLLSFAPVLPENHTAALRQPCETTWRQKMKTSGDLRRLMFSDRHPIGPLPADMIEELPLGNPVCTHSRPVRLQLPVEIVKFTLEDFGSLIQLKLCKAFGKNGLHLIERMCLEEIQHHRVTDDELTIDGLRLAGQSLGDHVQINVGRWSHDRESNEVFSPSTGTAGDLLHFSNRQVCEVTRFA